MSSENIFKIAQCDVCKKKHQLRIQVRRKYGKYRDRFTEWKPVCSPKCAIEHVYSSDPTFEVMGMTKQELEKALGTTNTIEGQKNVIDTNFDDEKK